MPFPPELPDPHQPHLPEDSRLPHWLDPHLPDPHHLPHPHPPELPYRLEPKIHSQQLYVRSFTGEEGISRLFHFEVVAHAAAPIPMAALLGQKITFIMETRPGQERRFLALIAAVDEMEIDEQQRVLYRLELVPRLWPLTRTVRARVFENLPAHDILAQVFEGSGVRLFARPREEEHVRPYCVQYFESDFEFALRLLEEEGYIYELQADKEQPVFAFSYFPAPSAARLGNIPFQYTPGGSADRILSWKKTRILTATTATARDHLFDTSADPVLSGSASVPKLSPEIPGWEALASGWSATADRYPGEWSHLFERFSLNREEGSLDGYVDFGGHRAWNDLRQRSGSTSASEGVSNCQRIAPASVFALGQHATSSGEYVIVAVRHEGSQAVDHSGPGSPGFHYENRFTAVPHADTMLYLPPRSTHKPRIYGCQTALVVGRDDTEEIWTDQFGRVQVRFWWDRDSTRSTWVRVSTPWAGSNWGIQHVPRVGQEVVVTFLDGDPDCPLIVGAVSNPTHMPPFSLPEHKTQSGIRTQSTPAAEDYSGSNEIRFEDASGAEEIYIHGQKDRTTEINHDSGELVGNDRIEVVGNNLHQTTVGEKRELVVKDENLTVGGSSMKYVEGKLTIAANEIHLAAATIVIEAGGALSLRGSGDNSEFIYLENGGGITIDSKGRKVWLNCGGKSSPDPGYYEESKSPQLPPQPDNPWEKEK